MPHLTEEGFKIIILEETDGYTVRVESSLGSKERFLEVNFQEITYYLKLQELKESLQRGYIIDKSLPEGHIKKFGKELFDLLLTEEMKGFFRKCFARSIQKFVPKLLAYPVVFQMMLTAVVIAVALLFMTSISKSPIRKSYRILFG